MIDTENKKNKSFYYSHKVGVLTDSNNGMSRFIRAEGHTAGFFYSLILEHLTSSNNRSDVDSIVQYFHNVDALFDDRAEIKHLIGSCPDLDAIDGQIYSIYLESELRDKLKTKEKSTRDSALGSLTLYLKAWTKKGKWEDIADKINIWKADDIATADSVRHILEYEGGAKSLLTLNDFNLEDSKKTTEAILEVQEHIARKEAKK